MRDFEPRLVDGHLPVEQEIEVEGARPPALLLRAVAAEGALGFEEAVEELLGREARLQLGGSVHEPRLVDLAHWIRLPEGRDGDHRDSIHRIQQPERLPERCLPVAEVRPESDVRGCPRHGHAQMLISRTCGGAGF
jgi:hypothetical protein